LVKFKGFDVLHLHGDDWFYLRRTLPTVHTLHGSALRDSEEQLWTVFVLTVWLHLPAGKLSCGDGLEALGE
jgi:phosphatidyl-myo-inositol alpha-mannosyltransferase